MTSRSDNFNRANSTTGLGSPSDGGSAWTDDLGVSGISSNKGYFPTLSGSRAYSWLEASSSIGKAQYTDGASGNIDTGVMIRYSDVNNFILFHQTNANSVLYKRVAGGFTTLSSASNAFVSGAVYSIEVDASNVIICKANGVTIHTVTDSFNSTATKVAMRSALSSATFDDFSFVDAAGGGAAALAGNAADVVAATGTLTTQIKLAGNAAEVVSGTGSLGGGAAALTGAATDVVTATGSLLDILTCTDQTNHQIFQRIGTTKSISFAGTYPGVAGTTIEIQLYASDGTTILNAWTALTSTSITGGNWSGLLNTPQGGLYRFAARFKNGGGAVTAISPVTTNLWGVGALILPIGSSSAVKWCDASSGTGFTANANVRQYDTTNAWVAAGTVGSMITVANALNTLLGVPIGIVQAGVGGSKLLTWSDVTSFDYSAFRTKLTAIGSKLELVMVTVGSNDASSGIVVSQADHMAKYLQFIANIRSDCGQASLPFYISGTSSRDGMDGTQSDWIRQVEMDLESYSNVYFASTNVDLEIDPADNIHLTVAGYTISLARMALAHNDILGSGTYHRGPHIQNYAPSVNTATVTIIPTGGTNLSVNAAHGFVASDGSGALSITSVTVATATTLLVTFGRAISGTLKLQYGHGSRPMESTQGVHDNTTEVLPLEVAPTGGAATLFATSIDTVTATGNLNTVIGLAGAALVNATATGNLLTNILMSGNAQDIASASGALTTQIKLNSASVDVVTATGNLTVGAGLSGNANNITTATGILSTGIPLTGSAVSLTSANGALTAQIKLSANAVVQALAAGGLSTAINLLGNAQDVVLANANIQTSILLTGAALDVISASGNIGAGAVLTGNALDNVIASGSISTNIALTGAAIEQILATGYLTTNIVLAGDAHEVVYATGSLLSNSALIIQNAFIVIVDNEQLIVYIP